MYWDRDLWQLTRGVRLRILGAAAMGLTAVVLGTLRLALLGWLLARVLGGTPLAQLVVPATAIAGILVVRGGLEYVRAMVAHGTAARVQAVLRRRLYDHVSALGPGHFTRARTGDVVLSVVEGVQQLEVYFGQYLPQLLVSALTPPLLFALVAVVDLPLAAILLVTALAALLLPTAWHRREGRNSLERSRAYAAYGAEFVDALQGLPTLAALGQSEARAAQLEARGDALFRSTMWVLGTNTMARGITDTAIAMGAALALAVGAWRVASGHMELAALVIVLMLGVEVFRPLRELRAVLHQGMLGLAAAEGIRAVLAARPAVVSPAAPVAAGERLAPTVAFEDVVFRYAEGRGAAHDGLSLAVAAGERVGIVGPSGAGKSTIARLLLRFADPQSGRVLVGGRDVRALGLDHLRAQIAVVSQDTYLFHGTVEENLRLGRPEASQAELEAAARAANVHDVIAALPQGYQTLVGERGVKLSGGQRQRIAIARALLRDAPILVLDEALSSVDAESEALILEALDRLMAGRTTLVFAHRLSSVIRADRVLVLEAGRVVESGTHQALMAAGGVYHRLMAAQAEDAPTNGAHAALDGAGERSDGGGDAGVAEGAAGAGALDGAQPGAPVAPGPSTLAILGILLRMVRSYRARLALTFVLGVARVAALIGVGALGALVVRAVARGESIGGLLLGLAVVAPLAGVLHWMESWLAHDLAYRLLAEMRIDLFRKLVSLGPAYLTGRRTGDLLGVATRDVELIEYFFAHTVTPGAVAILVPTAVLLVLAVQGWPLALVVLPFLLYAGLSPILGRGRIDALGRRSSEATGELTAHAVDSIQGLAEIVAFQAERTRGDALESRARAYGAARLPLLADLASQAARQEIATGLGGLAVAATGAWLVAHGGLEAGLLPLLTLLAMSAFVPVWEIAQVGRQIADTLAATRRVHAVHVAREVVRDGPEAAPGAEPATANRAPSAARDSGRARDGAAARDGSGRRGGAAVAIELDDVAFAYPGRARAALAGVTLTIAAGSTVALVGPSGAGKTTIAHLLLRFWDPDRGVIRLGGRDLRSYRLAALRQRIALVAQDTYLFHDTLGANIRIARPDASPAALADAVEHAALGELVAALPQGLDTPVGERGLQLSGGQRQRVAIARAFLRDAPVLVLDEATSHLDALNERSVQDALDALSRHRTTLVIAHRLSTVRGADRIAVLEAGRVAESGPHEALLARGGLYARLVAHQLAAVAR